MSKVRIKNHVSTRDDEIVETVEFINNKTLDSMEVMKNELDFNPTNNTYIRLSDFLDISVKDLQVSYIKFLLIDHKEQDILGENCV